MKKSLLVLSLVGASALAGGYVLAQVGSASSSGAKPAPASNSILAPVTAPKMQRLVRVSTLTTADAVQAFQNNVQVIQAQRQRLIETNTAMEKETDAKKKKELKATVDELLAKLNADNQAMIKAYGFSLERNYTLVPEVAHIYMFVTDEEADRFEKNAAEAAKKKK